MVAGGGWIKMKKIHPNANISTLQGGSTKNPIKSGWIKVDLIRIKSAFARSLRGGWISWIHTS